MKQKVLIATLALLTFIILMYGNFFSRYKDSSVELEERGIQNVFTGDLVVQPAVVDYEIENGFSFGYRLPSTRVVCQSGKFFSYKLSLKPVYFLLDNSNGEVIEFSDRKKFLKHLHNLNIELGVKYIDLENSPLVLHYKELYETIQHYSTCVPVTKD